MANPLSKHRKTAFEKQNGHCCYCGFLMWQDSAESFAQSHRISVAQAKHFQCTAEHLKAREVGGKDCVKNIAAACVRCNRSRHNRKKAPEPVQYQELVQKRLNKGGWISLPAKTNLARTVPPDLSRLFGLLQGRT
jgi:5-methylcytosine-specific restriction endonuclease McrA